MGFSTMKKPYLIGALGALLAGCASDPLIEASREPVPPPQPFIIPQKTTPPTTTASLWTSTPNALLSMRRAKEVGDLLTVVVEMNDQANLQSSLSRTRNSNDNLNVNALLGLPQIANSVLPGGATLNPGIDMNRSSNLNGNGSINRAEQITFRLASRVVGVEPNGNLIIQGYQQTQVSNEIRYLTVTGVVRAQDITRTNTVTYDKIADAQLAYVNSGEATGATKRNFVPRVLDKYVPF